jgi:glycosyltransferase involved in cell wall biosynthesis
MLLSDQPLVSVVIPSYNHANFIGKAVQSVLDQTYNKYEIIVIDNHSNDGTHEIVASFEKKAIIRMLDINNNGIIAASRNMGISAAQGEWVAFLDSDDSWMPDKLEKTMK